jgi:serine/threonine-protein kinase
VTTSPLQIGKYQIIRRLGRGGMGTVYLGLDPGLDRHVAVKVLHAPLLEEELLQRFLREARAAASLRHNNIVTVYEVGQHDHEPFIAMEFVDGTSVEEIIRQRRPIPLAQKLSYIEQICAGLHHAHGCGIVHRDTKPANLMVDRHDVVRILDFGIARVAGSGMTADGTLMGTFNYMSPEQMLGRQVDHRSDIFSVGAVAYELLAYEKAFPGGPDDGLLHRLPHEPPAALSRSCPGLSPELEQIVMRALAKSPDERFAALDDMATAIVHARRTLDPHLQLATIVLPRRVPTAQPQSSSSLPSSDEVRRNAATTVPAWREKRNILAAAAVASVAVVAGGFWSLSSPEAEPPSSAPATVESSTPTAPPPSAEPTSPAAPPLALPTQPPNGSTAPTAPPVETNLPPIGLETARERYRNGDLSGALAQIERMPADDQRVVALSRSVAEAAVQSMDSAAAAAVRQKAPSLASTAMAAADGLRRGADAALRRNEYAPATRQAIAAADAYRRAEAEATRATEAVAVAPTPQPVQPPPAEAAPVSAPSNATPPPPAPSTPPRVAAAGPAEKPDPAPAAAPPAAIEVERSGILRALTRYQDAYRGRSVKDLQTVYPSLPRETGQRLDRQFRDCRDYDVTFGNMQLSFSPDDPTSATVTVRTTYTCQPRTGQSAQPQAVQDIFLLRKVAGEWLIDSAGMMDTAKRR